MPSQGMPAVPGGPARPEVEAGWTPWPQDPSPPCTDKQCSARQWAPQVDGRRSHTAFFGLFLGAHRAGNQGGDKVLGPRSSGLEPGCESRQVTLSLTFGLHFCKMEGTLSLICDSSAVTISSDLYYDSSEHHERAQLLWTCPSHHPSPTS